MQRKTDWHLARWVKIGSYTVYKKVIQYEKNGLITGFLFLINSALGLRYYILSDGYAALHLILGICIGGILFGAPIGLSVVTYQFFEKYIK